MFGYNTWTTLIRFAKPETANFWVVGAYTKIKIKKVLAGNRTADYYDWMV
jgi:hypothetical protein